MNSTYWIFSKVMFKSNIVFCSLIEDDDVRELRLRLPDVMIGVINAVVVLKDSAS